ncbi:MAG: hypothetical protein HY738_21200 [Bacteroidia bacterium]|nr:hypothetical protein [Bacteroidia bacterium]
MFIGNEKNFFEIYIPNPNLLKMGNNCCIGLNFGAVTYRKFSDFGEGFYFGDYGEGT